MTTPAHGGTPGPTGLPVRTHTAPGQPGSGGPPPPVTAAGPDSLRRRVLTAAALVLVAAGLFLCYVTVSAKAPVTSVDLPPFDGDGHFTLMRRNPSTCATPVGRFLSGSPTKNC